MAKLVDIRAGERGLTLAAFFVLLGITASHMLLETARDALFLAKLPASHLPFMYLALAGLGLAIAHIQSRNTGPPSRLRLSATIVLIALATAGCWLLSSWKGTWFLYVLYIYAGIASGWIGVELWLLLGRALTVGQAKRLFGFIGTGGVLGAVAGAALARALAGAVSSEHLLLGAAITLLITGLGPAAWLRVPPESSAATGRATAKAREPKAREPKAREPKAPSSSSAFALVLSHPYFKRILALVLLTTLTVTAVDYVFKAAIKASYQPDELGQVFATAYLIFNVLSLVAQLIGVGWLLRALGVQRALWIMPILIMVGAGGLVLGGILVASGGLVFAYLLKGVDGTLRHSVHQTSLELLYVPTPDAQRARAKPIIDLVGKRGGQAAASLGILALTALGPEHSGLAIAIIVLAVGWVAVAATLRRHYLEIFRTTLREGRIEYDGALPELDIGALESLFAALNSSKDAEVLGAMEFLALQKRRNLIPALILYHPSKAIVLRALDLMVEGDRTEMVPITLRLLERGEPEIQAAALRACMAVDPHEELLRQHMDHPVADVRAAAIVGLVARDLLDTRDAETELARLANGSPAERAVLARSIAAEPSPRFEQTLVDLAETDNRGVRFEVARAMGRMGAERFLPVLLPMLARRHEGAAARHAMAAIGDPALDFLARALGDDELPHPVYHNLPRAMAHFPAHRAAPSLLGHLTRARDELMRNRIISALGKLRRADPSLPLDDAVLTAEAERWVAHILQLLSWKVCLDEGAAAQPARRTPALQLMLALLADREDDMLGAVFRLLGLLYPEENFVHIYRGLQHGNPQARASSCELIENLVEQPLRATLLALLDDLGDSDRIRAVPADARPSRESYEKVLLAMGREGEDLGGLAEHHMREIGLRVEAPKQADNPRSEA